MGKHVQQRAPLRAKLCAPLWLPGQTVLVLVHQAGQCGIGIGAQRLHQRSRSGRVVQAKQNRLSQTPLPKPLVVLVGGNAILEVNRPAHRLTPRQVRAVAERDTVLLGGHGLHVNAGREVVIHAAQGRDRVALRDQAQADHLGQVDLVLDERDPLGVVNLADFVHVVRLPGDVALQVANPRTEAVPSVSGVALVLRHHLGQLDRLGGKASHIRLFGAYAPERVVHVAVERAGDELAHQAQALHIGDHAADPLATETLVLRVDRHTRPGAHALGAHQQRREALEVQALLAELVHERGGLQARVDVQRRVALLDHGRHLQVVRQHVGGLHGVGLHLRRRVLGGEHGTSPLHRAAHSLHLTAKARQQVGDLLLGDGRHSLAHGRDRLGVVVQLVGRRAQYA